jgi:hypothetical protein
MPAINLSEIYKQGPAISKQQSTPSQFGGNISASQKENLSPKRNRQNADLHSIDNKLKSSG